MSTLRQVLSDYLTMRRALGYKLDKTERLLGQFVSFSEARGEVHLTTETALAWATQPAGAAAVWTSRRLSEVRLFARHLQAIDPASEVPPMDLLPGRTCRATPYLYMGQEISDLMRATEILRGSHLQATYRTLIGLLAATGMRIGEAIGLDCDDFDAANGILTVRNGKFGKSRELPLHPTTAAALDTYLRRNDRPGEGSLKALLSNSTGKRLRYTIVQPTFSRLLHHCGIVPRSAKCRPRIHDLRHSFAVNAIADGYRAGDPGSRLAILSTYLGHADPGATYWYLSAAPELLGLACERLECHLRGDA
jgi:integrase/recombinase XerD